MNKSSHHKLLSIIKHKSAPDLVDEMGDSALLLKRTLDKKSTIFLTSNAFMSRPIQNRLFLDSTASKPMHSTTLSENFDQTQQQTPQKHNRTIVSQTSSNKFPTGELVVRKVVKVDPLFLHRKETFVTATRDQNVHHLFSLLRKGIAKVEDPTKMVRMKSKKFEKIENTRKNEFKKFVSSTKTRGQTFVKFAFQSHEKADNHYIQQYMQEIATSAQYTLGSMTVSDLWSNKQLLKFLKSSNLNNDKIMFQKLNKIMIQDRRDANQKELVQQKQMFKEFKEETHQQEHLGKNIYFPKKRYQQQIQAKQVQIHGCNSNDKITELVSKIDEIHDDNLYLYQNMTNILEKIQLRPKQIDYS